jgi:hypothetical protein
MLLVSKVIFWIGTSLMVIGFGCLATVQLRHAARFGGQYRSLLKKPIDADLQLLKTGLKILACSLILLGISFFKLHGMPP